MLLRDVLQRTVAGDWFDLRVEICFHVGDAKRGWREYLLRLRQFLELEKRQPLRLEGPLHRLRVVPEVCDICGLRCDAFEMGIVISPQSCESLHQFVVSPF